MNIFYTNPCFAQCALEHCDRHRVKMILEYAQLLCTTNRFLDGVNDSVSFIKRVTKKKVTFSDGTIGFIKKVKLRPLKGRLDSDKLLETRNINGRVVNIYEPFLYLMTHVNHPCAKWVRENCKNYKWLYFLFAELCYLNAGKSRKEHLTWLKLGDALFFKPKNIANGKFTTPPQCMPDEFKSDDTCKSYQQYLHHKYVEWVTRDKPLAVEFYFGEPSWFCKSHLNFANVEERFVLGL